ncbi:MAG TPA: CBS domain-containing protein [Myxococcales bacterium]|nr:CBS domain-containing protein [Myxococcales bacterium]
MEDLEIDGKSQRPLIERAIETEQIRALGLGPAITARRDSTLEEVVRKLQEQHIGCVLVTGSDGRLEGIFTERDLLSKVALRPIDWSKERVGDYMTPEPETLRLDDHVAWALKLMHVGGYRHVPLTDAEGRPVGVVSIRDIVEFIIDLFPAPVLNLPPEPRRGTASSDEAGGGTD